ncbi:Golgi vesicle transport-related protein [Dacryopinax primogenitus]|uniref:Protein CASP n=1 Tax=Dacryopinax primogenitus (strain DJM 731) TaxID=1858805 RepID=M5G5R1_DACPD|nr:Golgi vesicle transport-related protein [Dacryopinax primogenitus]EJU04049.1 Golgi vesicle transport-related protein [Dacryopinax primogenitus]
MASDQNFSQALATWKEVNLTDLQKALDSQGLEIVENQKESVVGRKFLADKTKEFRRIPDEEKLNEFKVLLKAYQTEIDNLTRRSKLAENSFLNVYKLLAEAPDPYPLLDVASDQSVKLAEARTLETEVARLREENADLKKKIAEAGTLEGAKKKAESRVEQLEEKMEAMIQEKVTQKENELNATYDEKIRNYEERERDLTKQVQVARDQIRDLRNFSETSQAKLLDQSQRQDQETMSRLAELDMLEADLERANSRIATVERRNELLRAEIEAVRSGSETADKVKALENQIAELEAETARLLQAFDAQKEARLEAESSARRKIEEFTRDVSAKDAEVESLRHKLKLQADYDEVKRELQIMKYVEFGGAELDESDDVHLPEPSAANGQQASSLETLLLAKNKQILDELTKFRILHSELEENLRKTQRGLAESQDQLQKQSSLNDKLENDLLQLNTTTPDARRSMSGTPVPNGAPQEGLAGLSIGVKPPVSADTSPRVSYLMTALYQADGSTTPSYPPQADTSILPIVTSQRDRFRTRNAELEEELRKQFDVVSELRTEIKGLQADNLKLYEKVRYMQSYRDEGGVPTPATSRPLIVPQNDEMSRYRNVYEESMNPFEAFRGREAARAVKALNPLERGVLTLTQAILANRRARIAFVIYAASLHILVMFTTYECLTSSSGGTPISRPVP